MSRRAPSRDSAVFRSTAPAFRPSPSSRDESNRVAASPRTEARMATPERRGGGIGGISLGGILVIIGIVVALFWSLVIGLIIVLIGLIAFGGFARGKWYREMPSKPPGCRSRARRPAKKPPLWTRSGGLAVSEIRLTA